MDTRLVTSDISDITSFFNAYEIRAINSLKTPDDIDKPSRKPNTVSNAQYSDIFSCAFYIVLCAKFC